MSLLNGLTQRAAALSIFALLALCYYVISREPSATQYRAQPASEIRSENRIIPTSSSVQDSQAVDSAVSGAGIWTFVFAYYSLFIHILVTFFPIRACWAVWGLTNTLKKTARNEATERFNTTPKTWTQPLLTPLESETAVDEGRPSSAWSDDTLDVELDNYDESEPRGVESVVHAIVIPNYKEEIEVLRETLDVLASHPRAKTCYDVSARPTISHH